MVSAARGARLGTVTAKVWRAVRPSVSVAATVTVVSPWERAVTISVPSAGDSVSAATVLSAVSAAQVSGSPSGSAK